MFGLIPLPYRILFIAACVVLASFGGYWKGRSDANQAAIGRERDALVKYTEKLKQAGEQHDQDQATINRLADNARRVRIHIPTCPDATTDQGGEAGILSGRVDELFAELQSRTSALIFRCDQLNIDAIRANATM